MYDADSEQDQNYLAQHKATMARALAKVRPQEPIGDTPAQYRGWEASYDFGAEYWTGEGWTRACGDRSSCATRCTSTMTTEPA